MKHFIFRKPKTKPTFSPKRLRPTVSKGKKVHGPQTPPLSTELRGLLLRLTGFMGMLVVGYSSYLLAPHLRELIYDYFGRPVGPLERGWNRLQGWLVGEGSTEETPKTTAAAGGGDQTERLLEAVKKLGEETRRQTETLEREIGRGQKDLTDQLERLRREQERTDDRLRELRAASGPSWKGDLLRMGIMSLLGKLTGWLLGVGGDGATRDNLKQVHDSLAQRLEVVNENLQLKTEVDNQLWAANAGDHAALMAYLKGILLQVNSLAGRAGMWFYDVTSGHFFDPQDPSHRFDPSGGEFPPPPPEPPFNGGFGGGEQEGGGPVMEEVNEAANPEEPLQAAEQPQPLQAEQPQPLQAEQPQPLQAEQPQPPLQENPAPPAEEVNEAANVELGQPEGGEGVVSAGNPEPEAVLVGQEPQVPEQFGQPRAEGGVAEPSLEEAAAAAAPAVAREIEEIREKLRDPKLAEQMGEASGGMGSALKGAVGVAAGVTVATLVASAVPVAVPVAGGAAATAMAGTAAAKAAAAVAGVVAANTTRWLLDVAFPARPTGALTVGVVAAAPVSPREALGSGVAEFGKVATSGGIPVAQFRAAEMLGEGGRLRVIPEAEELLQRGVRENLRPFPGLNRHRGMAEGGNAAAILGEGVENPPVGRGSTGLWIAAREKTRSWVNNFLGREHRENVAAAGAEAGTLGCGSTAHWLDRVQQRMAVLQNPETFRELFRRGLENQREGRSETTGTLWPKSVRVVAEPVLNPEKTPAWLDRLGFGTIRDAVGEVVSVLGTITGVAGWSWTHKEKLALMGVGATMGPWVMATGMLLTGNVARATQLGAGLTTRWLLGSEQVQPCRNALEERSGEAWTTANREVLALMADPATAQALEVATDLYLVR